MYRRGSPFLVPQRSNPEVSGERKAQCTYMVGGMDKECSRISEINRSLLNVFILTHMEYPDVHMPITVGSIDSLLSREMQHPLGIVTDASAHNYRSNYNLPINTGVLSDTYWTHTCKCTAPPLILRNSH